MLLFSMPKPPGAGGAHGVDDSIIDRHARQQKGGKFQQSKYNIYQVQDFDAIRCLGDDLIHGGAGHFRPQDVMGTVGALAEMMVTNTRIPMPPIQWVKQRQNCME